MATMIRVEVPAKLARYCERELGRLFRETAPGRVDLSVVIGTCALAGVVDLIHDIGRPRVTRATSTLRSYLGWYHEPAQERAQRKAAPRRAHPRAIQVAAAR